MQVQNHLAGQLGEKRLQLKLMGERFDERLARCVFVSTNNFREISSVLDFCGSDAVIGYHKQFKNVHLDSLGKA